MWEMPQARPERARPSYSTKRLSGCRLEQLHRLNLAGTQAFAQLPLLLAHLDQALLLDVAITADLLRQFGQRHGAAVVAGIQLLEQVVDAAFVVLDQLQLQLAFGAVAEQVERRAAQDLELGQ